MTGSLSLGAQASCLLTCETRAMRSTSRQDACAPRDPSQVALGIDTPAPTKNPAPPHQQSTKKLRLACVIAFIAGSAAMLMYQPFSQAVGGDDAIWDYVAQSIVRGQVPYRDVIEIKTPGSAYLSAIAILIGKLPGLQDILSIRVLFVLLVGVLSSVTLLTTFVYTRSLLAGSIATLLLITWPELAEMMISGTRPKVPMIIFGLLSLVFIAWDKAFWAGVCSMLSCLCWQPGLLFTAAAFLVFSKYLTTWRDLRALKVALGAALPLGLLLIFYGTAGALDDLWTWTVAYNYLVYMPEGSETAGVALARLWYLIAQVTGGDTIWVKLAIAGFLVYFVERILVRFKSRTLTGAPDLFKDVLIIVPLLYLAFKVINYPGTDDLIPLFPFIGLFAGYIFVVASRSISALAMMIRNEPAVRLSRWVPVLPAVVLVILAIMHGMNYRVPSTTLQDQQRMVQAVADLLAPDDKIYVHGTLELLVLMNKPNMNPYIFFDRGKDTYIANRTPGGFAAIMDQMKSESPKVIAISRTQNVAHRQELFDWAAERYDRFPLKFAHNSAYVRKEQH